MAETRRLPVSLHVVAALFFLGGIFAVIEIFLAFTQNRISINFGVLGIPIGLGLYCLRPGWRTCALVFLWIVIIALPIITLIIATQANTVDVSVLGVKVGKAHNLVGVMAGFIMFAVVCWQYHVLTRPEIRALFGLSPRRVILIRDDPAGR